MAKISEIVYIILDELKNSSDDLYYTEEHIRFLIGKHRALLLKQRYADIKKKIPDSNYQTICLNLELTDAIEGEACEGGPYLRSVQKVPFSLSIAKPRVSSLDFFKGEITFVDRNRFRYVGHNKWLKHFIYATIGPDNYLYFKSPNPQHYHLKKARLTGVFEDTIDASKLMCNDGDEICDEMDMAFPLEEALIPPLVQLVVQELGGALYRPKDDTNNSKDDLSDVNLSSNDRQ